MDYSTLIAPVTVEAPRIILALVAIAALTAVVLIAWRGIRFVMDTIGGRQAQRDWEANCYDADYYWHRNRSRHGG